MKILILGANGQVGNELKKYLLSNLNNAFDLKFDLKFAYRDDVDLEDLNALESYLDKNLPDWIINTAAYTDVDKSESNKKVAYIINELSVDILAKYCAKNNSRLVHISSDYVFNGSSSAPYNEINNFSPLGIYGASKLAGEYRIKEQLDSHLIIRTAWVFGFNGNNFVKTMLRLAKNKTELSVVGDQVGSPTSAKAIADVIARLIIIMYDADKKDPRWGTYHFSGNPFVSWAEFAEEIFKRAESKSLINGVPKINYISTDEYPTPAKRPINSRLDCTKIKEVFGISNDNWKESLDMMLDELSTERFQ